MATHRPPLSLSRRAALAGLAGGGLGLTINPPASYAAAQLAASASPRFEREPGIVYGETGGEVLRLDIYRPVGWEGPRPAVLVFHGGGLVSGGRFQVSWPAMEFALAGYIALAVGYRLFDPDTGANAWPAQLDDAQRAVRWVRANAHTLSVDPQRVAAYGHASGGTLATALGVQETRDDGDSNLKGPSSRVQCVVDLSGDVDLTIPYPDATRTEINATMLGGTRREKPAAYRDASPLTWVDADSVPFLVIHGVRDEVVPVEHSRRLVAALRGVEVEVTYGEYPRAYHLTTRDWRFGGPWALAFLSLHLRPER